MNTHYRRFFIAVPLFLSLATSARPAAAQQNPLVFPAAAPIVVEEVRDRILRGRELLDENDELSVATLRDASQNALAALGQVAGKNVLEAAPASLPSDVVTVGLAQRAAEAHYYWGLAADKFARRDEAITALARSVRLWSLSPRAAGEDGTLARDALLALKSRLRAGLPLVAPDDVLDSIARFAHGGQWTPRRVVFDASRLGDASGAPLKEEFLITDGNLFPPLATTGNPLVRIPTYYQDVPRASLPSSLQLSKMVTGYARQMSGPNRGQLRQVVRVFYASPFVTKDQRDDLPRARALCEQFLRVYSLFRQQLGVENLYTRGDKTEGVTTLWLLEVSAIWPQDDDDPSVLAQLGPNMPGLNVSMEGAPPDLQTTPLMRPWMAVAGQNEASPGEIMFWKAGLARSEAEWVRELCHEYGHVSLPPLGGFQAPLEPYANGIIGETLGLMWAAQIPDRFSAPGLPGDAGLGADFTGHVNDQALPALEWFRKQGPNSPLRATGTRESWKYLQGLTVYLERVYGARMLGRALVPLSQRAVQVSDIAARRSLMGTPELLRSVETTWRDPWNGTKTLPIWLPGALNLDLDAAKLISRGEATLKSGTRAEVLLWVPPGADSLRIDGAGAQNLRGVGLPYNSAPGAMRLYFAGKSGWQRFSLMAGADARISAARFERK